jgi:hypothetical protein
MVAQATIGTNGGTENTDRILEELPPGETTRYTQLSVGSRRRCLHALSRDGQAVRRPRERHRTA